MPGRVYCDLIVAAAGPLTMLPARSATTTGSIQISVTIPKTCSFSTSNLAFGIYHSAQLNATGTVTAQIITACGRFPAGQYTNPGAYTDTLTFTLYF